MTGIRVAVACAVVLVAAGCPSRSATAAPDLDLHRHAIVVDTHSDCTQRIAYDGVDFAKPVNDAHPTGPLLIPDIDRPTYFEN